MCETAEVKTSGQAERHTPQLFSQDPAAIAAAEEVRARIQAAYWLALQRPRNELQARADILSACQRPEFAERVEYEKPVSGRKIRGPSVRFAEEAIRSWGNIMVDTQVIYEDDKIRRIKVTCLDLESNSAYSKQIQIRKTVERKSKKGRVVIAERQNTYGEKVYVVEATDDELHNKESALISKSVRNEGLRLIPSDIVDEGVTTARATLHNRDSKDPAAARKAVADSFVVLGVQPTDLEKYLGHQLDQCSPAQLQELRAIYRAISDGESTWHDVLENVNKAKQENGESGQTRTEQVKKKAKKKIGKPTAEKDSLVPPAAESSVPPPAGLHLAPKEPGPSVEPDDFEGMDWNDLLAWAGSEIIKRKLSSGVNKTYTGLIAMGETDQNANALRSLAREIAAGKVK